MDFKKFRDFRKVYIRKVQIQVPVWQIKILKLSEILMCQQYAAYFEWNWILYLAQNHQYLRWRDSGARISKITSKIIIITIEFLKILTWKTQRRQRIRLNQTIRFARTVFILHRSLFRNRMTHFDPVLENDIIWTKTKIVNSGISSGVRCWECLLKITEKMRKNVHFYKQRFR